MSDKISLPFVKNGESFDVPAWTLKDQIEHDEHMDDLAKKQGLKPADDKYLHLFNEELALRQLKRIDPSVTVEHIRGMHPRDFIDLVNALFNSGRKGIHPTENFQDKKP